MGVELVTNEQGTSREITGNSNTVVLTPPQNCRFVVKGLLLNGEGNTGTSSIVGSSGRILLKLYHSNQSTVNPAGRTHIDLNVGETISFVTEGRGAGNRTFAGVSVEIEEVR